MQQSKAAMWYDATVAASTIDASHSPVRATSASRRHRWIKTSSRVGCGRWALALGERVEEQVSRLAVHGLGDSKEYIDYDASKNGWASVPPGTRTSTYQNPDYQAAAGVRAADPAEMDSVNVNQPGVHPQPVPGIQYVGIPEFEDFGQQVSAEITAAIDGQESVADGPAKSQTISPASGYRRRLQEVARRSRAAGSGTGRRRPARPTTWPNLDDRRLA